MTDVNQLMAEIDDKIFHTTPANQLGMAANETIVG